MKQKKIDTTLSHDNHSRHLSDKAIGYGKDGLKVLGGAAAFWAGSKVVGGIKTMWAAHKLNKVAANIPTPTE